MSRGQYTNQIGRSTLGPRGRGGFPRVGVTTIGIAAEALDEDAKRLDEEVRFFNEQLVNQLDQLTQSGQPGFKPLRDFIQRVWTPFRTEWIRFRNQNASIPTGNDPSSTARRAFIQHMLSAYQGRLIDVRVASPLGHYDISASSADTPSVPSGVMTPPTGTGPVPPGFGVPSGTNAQPTPSPSGGYGLYIGLGLAAAAIVTFAVTRHAEGT